MKKVVLGSLVFTSVVFAGVFDKPFPICSSIKSYMAYEMAVAIKKQCDPYGVAMTIKDLHKTFLPMMTDEYASVSECNTACMLLQSTNGTNMGDCVQNTLTAPFVNSAINAGNYNDSTCKEMRSRIK
jgi:hypothetical protein